jgi:hypothetical protein
MRELSREGRAYTILRTRHFLMRRGDGRARPAGGRALTAAASAQRALAPPLGGAARRSKRKFIMGNGNYLEGQG